jgi:hypothetical protein
MASEDEDIDKLKLPAAVKLAKEKNISISRLKYDKKSLFHKNSVLFHKYEERCDKKHIK